jgi:transposase
LLRSSYIPNRPQRELRELTRYRTALVREQARELNRLQKVLEGPNVKLGAVASTMAGRSVRAMLEALVAGTTDPVAVAELAQGRLRAERSALQRALAGRLGAHQRFMLAEQLAHLEYLEEAIAHLNAQVRTRLRPFEAELGRLDTIPGVARTIAEVSPAELGIDMARFPTERHCASWSGLCPGQDESAGKLGGNFFDERDKERIARRQVARLERLGYHVTLERIPA